MLGRALAAFALLAGVHAIDTGDAAARSCGGTSTAHGAAERIVARATGCRQAERVMRRWIAGTHDRGRTPRRVRGFRCRVRSATADLQRVRCRRGRRYVRFRRLLAPTTLPPLASFSASSPFNRRIGLNPAIDPRSRRMVSGIREASSRQGATVTWRNWSVPVYFADANTPRTSVRMTARWAPRRKLLDVPLPRHAAPDPKGDAEMTVIDTTSGCEYDFWRARRRRGSWRAAWGNALPLDGNGVFARGLSARGSGFALIAGLIRPEELRAGYIGHALIWSYYHPAAGGPVAPATESDGVSRRAAAIPEGALVQLDPSLDLDALGLRGYERTIARALQEYGAYLADIGSAFAVYAMHPMSRRTNPYAGTLPDRRYPSLEGIPLERLRVLRLPRQRDPEIKVVANGCNRFR